MLSNARLDCLNAGADIVFVLDASGSIGGDNFLKVKQFVKETIGAFDIGFDKTRVGIVQYSSSNQISRPFDLSTYNNKTEMLAAVDRLKYAEGSTRTDLAIDLVTNVSFTASRGARPVSEVNTIDHYKETGQWN
jgi:collagen type XII alpha